MSAQVLTINVSTGTDDKCQHKSDVDELAKEVNASM
jgi:hypothetical protein